MQIKLVVFLFCVTFMRISCEDPLTCPTISVGYPPYCVCNHGPPYDNITNTCPNPECPPASIAQLAYPNCICTEKNFDYNAYVNECFQFCPDNSTGYWPNCTCDDEFAIFVKKQFKCIKCPDDSEKGDIFPNCNCEKVGQYSQDRNECIKCAKESIGMYPNCTCIDENASFNDVLNSCKKCPVGSSGKLPNCICDNGAEYNKYGNYCEQCPFGSSGIFPKCECTDGGYFNGRYCENCPWGSTGSYGNCTCDGNGVYDKANNNCNECPYDSIGTYPSCICNESFHYYIEWNSCRKCPGNLNGTYPYCECANGLFGIINNVCVECPADSTGVYPDCECNHQDHVFSAYINECYIECGSGSEGKYPHCKCETPGTYYDPDEFECKSNVGRSCPLASIGIGEDCLCLQKRHYFVETLWKCHPYCPENSNGTYPDCVCANGLFEISSGMCVECPVNSTGVYPECVCKHQGHAYIFSINECLTFECGSGSTVEIGPDCYCVGSLLGCAGELGPSKEPSTECRDDNKWPQCGVEIDKNVLFTLVG